MGRKDLHYSLDTVCRTGSVPHTRRHDKDSSTWQIWGGNICVDGSERISQSVDMVGFSATNFADAAIDFKKKIFW